MEHHGTPFKARWRVMRERILAMKELWTKEEAEFHGEFVRFDKSWSWPKPARKPHPPILMGGDGPTTLDRVVEYCDGWMPIGARAGSGLLSRIATLRERWAQAGRDPKGLDVTIFGVRAEAAALAPIREAGVTRAVFMIPSTGREETLRTLDDLARLIR